MIAAAPRAGNIGPRDRPGGLSGQPRKSQPAVHHLSGALPSVRRGSFYDGTRLSVGGNLIWRPSRNLGLKAGYSFNDISLPAGDFTTRIVSGTAEIAFNSFLSWVTLLQYDNVSEVMGLQTRLVWVPRAGRKYFLVANRGLQDVDKDGHFSLVSTEISLRAGYTWRF